MKLFSHWRQSVNASLPSKGKVTFINYQCSSPCPMLLRHKLKNNLAVDGIDLPGKCLPQKRQDFQQHQFTAPLYFMATVMLVSQISKSQVCYQEQLATSRYSRGPCQFKPWRNSPSPTEAVYMEARDTSGFHPNFKRYILA